jgi:cytoskeleton protein RodZ
MSLATGAFGERLRREREMRQITLEEISGSTKISKRHLQALEQEDFDALPGGIFNKGFVRAYARYVGIDEEQAITDYMAADNQQSPAEARFPLEIHKPVDLNPRRSYAPVILALVALVIILGGWTYWKHRQQRVVTPANPGGSGASNSGGSTASPSATSPVSDPSSASTTPAAGADSATSKDASIPTPDPTQTPAQPDGQFTVVVKVNERSWISIKADGRAIVDRTFDPGEEKATSAAREITLTAGNAGGVEVRFNGASQGVVGQEGKARTLVFTPAGLQNRPVPQTSPRLQ